MNNKICTKCKQDKDITNFSWIKARQRHHSWCKTCASKSRLDSYYKDKKRHREKDYLRRQRVVDSYKSLKENYSCFFCEETEPVCLDFHHIDPKTKLFNIGKELGRKSKQKIDDEIEKCVILCSNCHRKLHAGKLAL